MTPSPDQLYDARKRLPEDPDGHEHHWRVPTFRPITMFASDIPPSIDLECVVFRRELWEISGVRCFVWVYDGPRLALHNPRPRRSLTIDRLIAFAQLVASAPVHSMRERAEETLAELSVRAMALLDIVA